MMNKGASLFSFSFNHFPPVCQNLKRLSVSISRGSSFACMKKELGMVGWPTKTLAINTIDFTPRDGRKVEDESSRQGSRQKEKRDKGKRSKANASLSIVPLCFQWSD